MTGNRIPIQESGGKQSDSCQSYDGGLSAPSNETVIGTSPGERSVPIMNRCCARLTVSTTKVTPSSLTPAGVPVAKTTLGRHTPVENRSTGGLAPPAVPPDSDHEQPFRFVLSGCSVGLSNLKLPTLGIPPRRRATPDCLGELRSPSVHAEEDVNINGFGCRPHNPRWDRPLPICIGREYVHLWHETKHPCRLQSC